MFVNFINFHRDTIKDIKMYQVPNQYNQMIYNNSNNPSIRNVYNSTNAPSNNNYQNYPTNNQDQSKIPLYFGPKKILNYYL